MFTRLKTFFYECIRVFKITKKPSGTEFKTIVKVSALGIAIIGFLGFLIQTAYQLLKWQYTH